MAMIDDPWAEFSPQPASAPQPGGMGVTMRQIGPSKAPPPQTPAQREKDVLDVDNARLQGAKTQAEIDKLRADAQRKLKDYDEAANEMLNVISTARESIIAAHDPDTTGIRGFVAAKIPGTKARDLSGKLDTIGANVAFARLQKMREESPTGGAVGNVSDTDMRLLKSTIAALDQSLSKKELQKNLTKVVDVYSRILVKLPGGRDILKKWREGIKAQKAAPAPDGWSIEEAD